MDREKALDLVKQKVKNKNLVKHMLATEVVMRKLAVHFSEDEELWGLAGLVHDLDYDETVNDFPNHGLLSAKWLEEMNVDPAVIQAVKAHPGHVPAETTMDKALHATDPITGLIVACALMHPSKKLDQVDEKFVLKRFKEKRFAAGANRDQISSCDKLGLDLEQFTQMSLEAMQSISSELGF